MSLEQGSSGGSGASVPSGGVRRPSAPTTSFMRRQTQATVNPDNPLIYLGQTQDQRTRRFMGGETGVYYVDVSKKRTLSQMMDRFDSLTQDQKRKIAKKLILAGLISGSGTLNEILNSTSLDELTQAYLGVLVEAAKRYANGQEITPDGVLDIYINWNMRNLGIDNFNDKNAWGKANKAVARGAGVSPATGEPIEEDLSGTHRSVNVSRDIWTAQQARGLARATLQNALGRDPTNEEYEDFVAMLQEEQRENPTRTITRTTTDEEGLVTRTNSRTKGGVDVEQLAYDYAREHPSYAEWNAVGTYLPLALGALSSEL